jgi:hypothetical protein
MEQSLREAIVRAESEARAAGKPFDPDRLQKLLEGYARYQEWRDRALTDGLVCGNADTGATARGQEEKAAARFSKAGEEAFKMILDLIRPDDPDALLAELGRTASDESRFFHALSIVPIARFSGQLAEYRRSYDEQTKNLTIRWDEINGISGQKHEELDRIVQETGLVPQHYAQMNQKLLDEFGEKIGLKYPYTFDPQWKGVIARIGTMLADTVGTIKANVEKSQNIYPAISTQVLMFCTIRREMKPWYEANSFERIEKEFTEAARKSQETAGGTTMTPGQRADAEKYVSELLRPVNSAMDTFADEHAKFTGIFSGVFINRPSDLTINQLARRDLREYYFRPLVSFDGSIFRENANLGIMTVAQQTQAVRDAAREEFLLQLREEINEKIFNQILLRVDSDLFMRMRQFFFERYREMIPMIEGS